jgi:hypothetical protein
MTKTFQTLGVVPAITDMLKQQGIVTPTPVQEQSIPSIFKGRDILAKAQTGTGRLMRSCCRHYSRSRLTAITNSLDHRADTGTGEADCHGSRNTGTGFIHRRIVPHRRQDD